ILSIMAAFNAGPARRVLEKGARRLDAGTALPAQSSHGQIEPIVRLGNGPGSAARSARIGPTCRFAFSARCLALAKTKLGAMLSRPQQTNQGPNRGRESMPLDQSLNSVSRF